MTGEDRVEDILRSHAGSIEPGEGLRERVRSGIAARRRRHRLVGTAAVVATAGLVAGAAFAVAPSPGRGVDQAGERVEMETADDHPPAGALPEVPPEDALGRARWQDIAPPPVEARSSPAVATSDEHLFVWGGSKEGTERRYADGALLDFRTGTWEAVEGPPGEPGRAGASAIWHEGRFVVVGGWNGRSGGGAAPLAFDPATGSWEVLPEHPSGDKTDPVLYSSGDEIVVAGGFESPAGSATATTGALDPATGAWRELDPAPWPLSTSAYDHAGSGAQPATAISSGIVTMRLSLAGQDGAAEVRSAVLAGETWRTLPPEQVELATDVADPASVTALAGSDTVLVAGLSRPSQAFTFTYQSDGTASWGPILELPLENGDDHMRMAGADDRWFVGHYGTAASVSAGEGDGEQTVVPLPAPQTSSYDLLAAGGAVLALDWGSPDSNLNAPPRPPRALALTT